MDVKGRVVVVTGGASGIGRALVERFHSEGAKALVVADLDVDGATEVADRVGGTAQVCDVADEASIVDLIDSTFANHGSLDLMVSNAGYVTAGALEAPDDELRRMFDVHVMSHLWAARHAIPRMVNAGGGYLLNTASAAGLLTQLGSLHYSITKHAAISLAEFVAITYGDRGIKVSVLCPQAVSTNIVTNSPTKGMMLDSSLGPAAVDGVLMPDELASIVIEGLREERFLILPHSNVVEYLKRKGDDVDRWLVGMGRFQQRLFGDGEAPADWLLS